jgi:hypothetical protein
MAQEPKNKQPEQPPQRRNRPEALSPSVTSMAAQAFGRAGFTDMTLVLRWEQIAGPELARLARPMKLAGAVDGGTLTLKCEPGAALFLQHESRSLIGRINGYLGRQAVSRIRFVQGELVHRPAIIRRALPKANVAADDPAIRYSGPESLKSALLGLAGARRRS